MKTNRIKIRPDRLNDPLATCFVGKLSSALFTIYGDIPDDIEAITVQIGRTADPDTGEARTNYTAAASETTVSGETARTFSCYLSPFHFPDVSAALEYHVIGTDENESPRWLGTGPLVVKDNPANGSSVEPEIIPADTYIRNPTTGLYHKLTAEVNEAGEVVVGVEPEGIAR